jgi:hypothetical protein
MKLHGKKHSARIQYLFQRRALDPCDNCGKLQSEHASGKNCLFEATLFKPQELLVFFEQLLSKGGVLTIKVGNQSLIQKIQALSVVQLANSLSGEILTDGDAYLGEIDAKER